MLDEVSGNTYTQPLAPLIAADGAGSVVRRAMTGQLGVRVAEDMLDHGYKELTLPAGRDGSHRIERNALHIWPRGGFMLIALPNIGRQLHRHAVPRPERRCGKLRRARQPQVGRCVLRAALPDVVPLMPGLAREFLERPVGRMGRSMPMHGQPAKPPCCSAMQRMPSCRSTARA